MLVKENDPPTPATRVWCDGCYDLVHFGHANSLRQAKAFGQHLVVGVHTDEEIKAHKGPPVFTFEERCKIVESIKWVDEIVKGSPYVTTLDTLDKNCCEFCCHGDDITITEDGVDTYQQIKEAGRYRELKRTIGISTTGLVNRILSGNSRDKIKHRESPWSHSRRDNLLLTSEKILQFSPRTHPKDGDKIIYVDGAFDIFHIGHVQFLEKAKSYGDFLIVGLYPDDVVQQYKGAGYPILTLQERFMFLLACKFVSDVVIGAPFTVTKSLMDHLKIDVVVAGSVFVPNNLTEEAYQYPKEQNKFVLVNSGSDMTTEKIVERIVKNRLEYEARNEKKEKKEIDLFNELEKMKIDEQQIK